MREPSPEQERAWAASLPWLQRECGELVDCDPAAREYTAILEYELPRDLRRPDVIILDHDVVVVLELKGATEPTQAGLDQVAAYARDLSAYHAECAGRTVVAVLVPTRSTAPSFEIDGVHVTGPAGVHDLVRRVAPASTAPLLEPASFLRDDAYAPLPTIVQAARELFERRALPRIKRARAATEPALGTIRAIAQEAAATSSRHLVLLSGVPGAGKTLVGLQLVHAGWLDDLAIARPGGKPSAPAVYLSGNGPLVQVLQDALGDVAGGKTFVQAIKTYVQHHRRKSAPVPPEHLIVFDEAQRAHDAERFAHVHKGATDKSEPAHMLEFCERIPGWCVLVALIGSGQAIHVGEEGGLPLWRKATDALPDPGRWTVHGASQCEEVFLGANCKSVWHPELNLDTELRFHLTPKLNEFTESLLDRGETETCARIAAELHRGGHRLLLTRSLAAAKNYVRERYAEAPQARFGILASSKDKRLVDHGIDNSFQTTKQLRVGPWYNADPSDPRSCCALETVATEFSSQGLELDFVLLAWGSDLLREEAAWSMAHSRGTRGQVEDPLRLRKNVYRVLLTRGRDGTIVFIPSEAMFDRTAQFLAACGFRELRATAD